MSELRLPLDRNVIRGNKINNAFGMVRRDSGGVKAHQGWDLFASPLTNCYAIADGIIASQPMIQLGYGTVVALEFMRHGHKLYAFYAHLSIGLARAGQPVRCGDVIALTGRSGNASNLEEKDLHLHFEIRTQLIHPGPGLAGRVDPAQIYGYTPLSSPHCVGRNASGGFGLKVKSHAF